MRTTGHPDRLFRTFEFYAVDRVVAFACIIVGCRILRKVWNCLYFFMERLHRVLLVCASHRQGTASSFCRQQSGCSTNSTVPKPITFEMVSMSRACGWWTHKTSQAHSSWWTAVIQPGSQAHRRNCSGAAPAVLTARACFQKPSLSHKHEQAYR